MGILQEENCKSGECYHQAAIGKAARKAAIAIWFQPKLESAIHLPDVSVSVFLMLHMAMQGMKCCWDLKVLDKNVPLIYGGKNA